MFHDTQLIEKIDKYIRHALPAEEMEAVAKEIDTNRQTARIYYAYREILSGFRRQHDDVVKQEFKELGVAQEQGERDKVTISILMKIGIVVGAAVAVLAMALLPGWLPEGWPFG